MPFKCFWLVLLFTDSLIFIYLLNNFRESRNRLQSKVYIKIKKRESTLKNQ